MNVDQIKRAEEALGKLNEAFRRRSLNHIPDAMVAEVLSKRFDKKASNVVDAAWCLLTAADPHENAKRQ